MESTKEDSASKSGGGGSGDDEYDRKFHELQKHIPFLKGMMRKLEHSSDKLRAAQLNKMKNLYSLLTHPQKRLKLETLEKCEDVLIKLQEKLKGCFGSSSKSSGNVDNGESSQSSSSASQVQPAVEKPSAPESESNNVPFLCDSVSKSTTPSKESGSGNSKFPSKSHDERSKAESANRLDSNLDIRYTEPFKSDAPVNLHIASVRPVEVIPCLDSPASPTQTNPVAATQPVHIPLERREPLSALQESRERLKKIMTTQQPPRRDSFTQPSFTVQQARTPVPEVLPCARDNPPSTPVQSPFNPPPPPHLGNAESRVEVPPPLPSPAYILDRTTPAKSEIDPDFPFLKRNESYLALNQDPEYPCMKKTESFIPPTSLSSPANNPDTVNRSPGMSLRAKLGQDIDVVHKVGVSTGGALRTLINKDDRKSIEKKDDEAEKEKVGDKPTLIDIEKATKDPRKDPRRSSIESQSSGGNTPSRVDPRRPSFSSTDATIDDNLGFLHARSGFHSRNDVGSHSMDNHIITPVSCSPSEGGRKVMHPPLINDPRQTQVPPLLSPPNKPASSPLFLDPQPNHAPYDPYPPVKPDLYSRPQNNQRAHIVCSTTLFPHNRPSVPRFQTSNRVLLPTPPNRIISPWSNATSGSGRQTSAHQLGLRYHHRSNIGQSTTEDLRIESNVAWQGIVHQPGRLYDSKNTVPEKGAIPSLFTPDRVRTNPPFEANTLNALQRREASADLMAGGRRESAQEKYGSTDVKKRGQDEKQDRERDKDKDRTGESKKSHRKAKDNFASPLGSLYDNVPPPKTGKGYGIQNFKIPKKKIDTPPENKAPALLPTPSPSTPVQASKNPVNEPRRISPLRDPRTLRGKSRPPSPVNEPQTPDKPVWSSDSPLSVGTVSSIASSEFPFKSANQGERLPGNTQSRTFPKTITPKGAPNAFTESDRKLHDDSEPRSLPEGNSNDLNRSSRSRSRAGSRSPHRSKSRGPSPWSGTRRSPERSKSRARSRPRSRTPERSKSRARSRPRSHTPERGRSRARSRPQSRSPERSKSRARSRPRSRTPERSKSRARSRQRSRTPRARSRLRSRTPDRSKSRAHSRLRSRTPERSRSRARSRLRSRTPVRRKSSRSPDGRKSRARSRNRSKSRGRSRSASASGTRSSDKLIGKGSLAERPNLSTPTKARSRSREKSSSGRSSSQESHQTNDSSGYSRSERRRNRSGDRDIRTHSFSSRRRSRSSSRNSPTRRRSSSRSDRSQRKRSESPSPRRSSVKRSRSRGRRKSRSRSLSREIEMTAITDSNPQRTEVTADPKLSPNREIKTESDVSSSSDSQPVKTSTVSDADSKEVLSTQSAEKVSVDSSVQADKEPSKPSPITNAVEDKLAALKDLLGNPDLMKYLLEKNIINLSAVGNIPSTHPVTGSNQTVETDFNNIGAPTPATPSVVDTPNATTEIPKTTDDSEAPKTAPTSESPKIAVPEVQSAAAVAELRNSAAVPGTQVPDGGVPKVADIAEDSQTSADALPTASNVEETPPLSQQVKRPTRRSRKKLTTRTKATRATAPLPEETSLVETSKETGEKQPQAPQPRRRGKNELERLQEDIREMFISAEVVTATGQRTCRVRREAQEQGAKSRNSSSEKSKTESDFDFRSRSRNREEKALNTSSDSNRSEGTADTEIPPEDSEQGEANSDDDDTPLNVIQRALDVRSPAVSECSPIRAASKKRKYNLIDSETESEIDNVEEGRVSSCSVVIENIAPLSLPKDAMVHRVPSRNMARRGRRLNSPNFGNRKVPLEEVQQPISREELKLPAAEEEEGENVESVKSLIDCNNIISWPDGEGHRKLTRRQLKMRLTEQDTELPKASSSKSDDASVTSGIACSTSSTPSANSVIASLDCKAVTSSISREVILFSSSSATSDQAPPNESGATISPAKSDLTASTPSSANDKTPAKNIKTDSKVKDKPDHVLPIAHVKTEPGTLDDSSSQPIMQESRVESAGNDFVYSNNFVKCRLCVWRGKSVVTHYKCAHPNAEVDYARFPTAMASKLYADSEREGYNNMTMEDLLAKFPISKQRARYLLRCVLCRCMSAPLRFSKHFSLHTGEYHYRCASCNFTAPSKERISEHFASSHEGKRAHIEQVVHGNVPPLNIALAYACSVCNFFQLQKRSVENHIMRVHRGAKDCVPVCVAVSELHDTAAAKGAVVATPTEDSAKETDPLDMPVFTREDTNPHTSENLSSVPTEAQVENIEATPVPPPIPCSTSTQHQDLPATCDSSSSPRKAVDLSVFITSETLESQEQQIEEERLKKLKDAEEALRNRPIKPRMSISDRIAERINAPQDIAVSPSDTSPLPSLRAPAARRANKSFLSMNQALDVGSPEQKGVRQQPAKPQDTVDENLEVAPASNAPSLSAGELISTVEMMRKKIETPILARNKVAATVHQFRNASVVDETISVATVFRMQDPNLSAVRVGDVEVRQGLMSDCDAGMSDGINRKPKDLLYSCHGDNCIFTSSLPKLYVDHLASDHHRWRVRQNCSVCQRDLEEPGDMVYAFNHIRTQHLSQEYPDPVQRQSPHKPQPASRTSKLPLVRARRIPGDKLSGPSKDLEVGTTPQPVAPPAEEESVPFCIIENVVSLSSVPTTAGDDNIDEETAAEEEQNTAVASTPESRPVPPAAPLSPQSSSALSVSSLEKTPESRNRSSRDLTPSSLPQVIPVPVGTPRSTVGRVSFHKTIAVANAMRTREKLRHFFKCTGRRCSYTTNLKTNFVYHYNVHVAKESERANPETQFEWNRCVYCGVGESSGGRLTDHMLQFHGECCYQCAYCLYRAALQSNVVFHQHISHPKDEVVVLECRRVAESPPVPTPIQKMKFYKCIQDPENCKEEFYFTEDFKFHLRARHESDHFHCSLCPSEFNSPELLLLHCNVTHFMRTYHCLYCPKAAETQKEMLHHMCYDHPEESVSVAARVRLEGDSQSSIIDIGEPPDEQKIQIVRFDDDTGDSLDYLRTLPPVTGGFQTEPSEETDDPMQEVQFDDLPRPTLNQEVIVLPDEDPTTDLEQNTERLRMALVGSTAPVRTGSVTKPSEPPPLAPLTPLAQVEPEASTSEPVRSEDRVLSADELVAKTMKEIENTGLTGRALYRCGHTDCSYTAENMAQLKDHIFVCDFSRLSPALICVHCPRVSKTVESFVEHLMSHGLHRYSCSLCDVREPTHNLITTHMKRKHYFTEINTVPLHPLQKDKDKALFTVYAKDVAIGKRRTKKPNKPVYFSGKTSSTSSDPIVLEKSAFSPEDIHLLPRSAVFPKELHCALCNYSNKVRCNLVRHLQHHAEGRVASPTPVVNPVPHLERNNGEKMFDTMTNHAVSSNLAQRRDSTTSAKELEELPIFVAEQARYACSVCPSVTSEDTLHLHLTALHPELKETGYECPHCRDRPIGTIPLDRIAHHLKMHDSTLYKCPYCNFHHYHRHYVHRHTQDKHPDQQLYTKVVREPELKSSSTNASEMSSEQSGPESVDSEPAREHQVVVFQCGICGLEGPRAKVLNHARLLHKIYASLKCASCDFKSNHRRVFTPHFRKTHDGVPQEVISLLKKVVRSEMVGASSNHEKRKELPTPSWQLQKGHAKHVRGIMFEENGPKPREMEHGDFGEASGAKRSLSGDHKDGPEPKRMFSTLQSNKSPSFTKDEPFEKYRCPKCSNLFENTESQFRIHLLEEAESSTWLCHICSRGSENFFCLVKHYATEHHLYDEIFVMKNALYDTRVTDYVNGVIAKHQKAKLKESQAASSSQDAGTSRVTRTSRSLASSPVAWTSGQASESSSDTFKKAKLQPTTPVKILAASSVVSPPRLSSSPVNMASGTLKKIMIVKPMSLPGKSAGGKDFDNLLDDPEDFEINIEEVEEDSRSNEEWERFEKPEGHECSICKQNFTSDGLLRSHVMSVHSGAAGSDRPFSCIHCNFTCKSKSEKRNHEMRHWLHRPFKCGHCGSQFVRELEVRKHSLKSHPGKTVEVEENHFDASEQAFLPLVRKRKRKIDVSRSPADKSKSSSRAASPVEKNSESPALKSICEEDYKHVFYPNVYKCSYCARRNTSLRQLEIHWESNHRTENSPSTFKYDEMDFSEIAGHKRPFKFRCGMCIRTGSLPALAEHYKEDHGDCPIALRGCPEKVFQCSLCVCHFKSAPCLNRHYDKKHPLIKTTNFQKTTIDPDAERRQYQCLWCEETSGTKGHREISDSLQTLAEHHHRFHCHLDPKYKAINNSLLKFNKPSEVGEAVSAGNKPSLSNPANWDAPGSSSSGQHDNSVDGKVRAVARKSTSKMRSVARKSTSKPSRACVKNVSYMDSYASSEDSDDEDASVEDPKGTFYGCPSSPVDVKRVTCPIQCGPVVRRVNVATAAQASQEM